MRLSFDDGVRLLAIGLIGAVLAPLKADFEKIGNTVRVGDFLTSGLHIIRVAPKALDGGADPRREGEAMGE